MRQVTPFPPEGEAVERRTPVDEGAGTPEPAQGLSEADEGCRCQACGCRYRVDFNVPDSLWQKIGMSSPSGLLCGRCIAGRVEGLGEFGAFEVVPVFDDTTVERVMWACAAVDDYRPGELSAAGVAYYSAIARAAVRALREGQ